MDTLLITQDDIKLYRPTAELDDARINPFILEAQISDLKPVLNAALYHELLKAFNDPGHAKHQKYVDLLHGKEYTSNGLVIRFDGIKPMLCYYTLARFVVSNPVHITRFGIVAKTTQQSTPADPAAIRTVVNELRSTAIQYQSELIKFLCDNAADYPLYNQGGGSNNAARRTSFNFFKL